MRNQVRLIGRLIVPRILECLKILPNLSDRAEDLLESGKPAKTKQARAKNESGQNEQREISYSDSDSQEMIDTFHLIQKSTQLK